MIDVRAVSANGVRGCIIPGMRADSPGYFRVYHGDGEFTDYAFYHSDLMVTIDDPDAYFYTTESGETYLDHSPATLGKDQSHD